MKKTITLDVCLDQIITGSDSKSIPYTEFIKTVDINKIKSLFQNETDDIIELIVSAFSINPIIGIRHAGTYLSGNRWHIQLLVNFMLHPHILWLFRKDFKNICYTGMDYVVINFIINKL